MEKPEPIKAYKFTKEVYFALKDFLEGRPFSETDAILNSMFPEVYEESTYITEEGVKIVTDYLGGCPRKEVKPLIESLKNGGIMAYNLEPKESTDEK